MGAGNVTVIGNPTSGGFSVIYRNSLGLANVPQLVASGTGTQPTIASPGSGIGREVQQITLVGASNGSAIFDLGGARSSSINWTAVTAGTLQSTLENIATIGAGNVTVIGPATASSTATYSIVFNNNLAGINLPQLLLNNAGFTAASLTFAQQSDGAQFNEAQRVVFSANSGTYALGFNGQTAAGIAFDATAATVQTALEALSNIAPGDVVVTGTPGNFGVYFTGALANQDVAELTLDASTLATTTAVSILTTQNGTTTSAPVTIATVQDGDTLALDEIQSISFTAAAGSYTLVFDRDPTFGVDNATTSALAFNATSGAVQAALQAIAGTSGATFTVGGTPGNFTATIADGLFTNFDPLTASDVVDVINEVQTISFTATSGNYTLVFDRDPTAGTDFATTSSLAFNATSGAVQSALQAIAGTSGATFTVSGTPGNFSATIANGLGTNFDQLTSSNLSATAAGATTTVVQGNNFGDEQQTVQLFNVTGGNFRLAFNGMTTANIAATGSAIAVQSALESLPTIGAGNVVVNGNTDTGFVIRFTGDLGNRDVSAIVPFNVSLTSGSVPVIAAGTNTIGVSPEAVTSLTLTRGVNNSALVDTGNNVLVATSALSLVNYVSGVASVAPVITDTAPAATIAGLLDLGAAGNRTISVPDSVHGGRSVDLLISADIGGAPVQFNKTGTGHLQLTGDNSFTGLVQPQAGIVSVAGANGTLRGATGITISADASFIVDNSAAVNNDRLANAISPTTFPAITMAGGTLEFIGNGSAAVNETIGTLTLNAAANQPSTIKMTNQTGQALQVNAASLTFGAGGTGTFVGGADDLGTANNKLIFATTPANVNNTLVNALLVGANGLDFVTHGANGISAAPFVTDINTATATQNVKATNGQTLTANRTINSLMLVGDGLTIDGAFTLTSNQGAKLVNVGGNNTINTTALNFSAGNALIQTELGSGLTITSNIQGTGTVRKELSGTLTLNPAANSGYSGSLTVNQGVVRAQTSGAFGSTAGGVVVNTGAALELENNLTIGNEALSIAGGGVRDEVQTVTIDGATSGDFTLAIGGATTTALPYNASAAAVQAALNNLSSLKNYGLETFVSRATFGTSTRYAIQFVGANGLLSTTQLSVAATSLGALGLGSNVASLTATNNTDGTIAAPTSVRDGRGAIASALLTGTGVDDSGALRVISGNSTWGTGVTAVTVAAASLVAVDDPASRLDFNGTVTFTGGLVKDGLGTLTLSGSASNPGAGTVNVNQGTLELNKSANVNAFTTSPFIGDNTGLAGQGTAVLRLTGAGNDQLNNGILFTINRDGRFDINGHSETIANLTMVDGVLDNSAGGGSLRLNTNATTLTGGTINTGTGTIELANNASITNNVGASPTVAGNLNFLAANRTITVVDSPAFNDFVVTANIGGTVAGNALTKAGTGILSLSGNNTFGGRNEVQSLAPSAGVMFQLSFNGATTATFTQGTTTLGAIEAALQALPTIGSGNVVVASSGSGFSVTFQGGLGGADVTTLGAFNATTGAALTVTTQTAGIFGTTLSAGGIAIGSNTAFGTGGVNVTGNSQLLAQGGDRTISNGLNVGAFTLTLGGRRDFGGTNALNIGGFGNLTGNAIIQVDDPAVGATISGALGESAAGRTLSKAGIGTLVLSGNNMFTGFASVGAGILRAASNLALGNSYDIAGASTAGNVIVNAGAALELANNITVSGKRLVINYATGAAGLTGQLNDFNGALRNVSGNNTWLGMVDMRSGSAANTIFVGVDAGSSLDIVGSYVHSALGGTSIFTAASNTVKVGDGTLRFSGYDPNYIGSVLIAGGTLELNKAPGVDALRGAIVVGDNIGAQNADKLVLLQAEQIQNGVSAITVNSTGQFDSSATPVANSEIQNVRFTNATGGTFTLSFAGQTTGSIGFLATPAEVSSALQNLSTVGVGNVSVSGQQGNYYVAFTAGLANRDVPAIGFQNALVGGTAAPLTVFGFSDQATVVQQGLSLNETQQVLFTATGGTFNLAFNGESATGLAFGASTGDVQTALNGLSTITAAGGVTVSGAPGNYIITFNSTAGVNQIAFDPAGLSGTSGTLLVQTIQQGGGAANESFIINNLPSGATTAQLVFRGQSTALLTGGFNATSLRQALESLVGVGNVNVTAANTAGLMGATAVGVSGPLYYVTFQGGQGGLNQGGVSGLALTGLAGTAALSITPTSEGGNSDDTQLIAYNATSGAFNLVFNGQTTGNLTAPTATAADVQTALAALPSIGVGNVSVSGTAGRFVVQFTDRLGGADQPLLQLNNVNMVLNPTAPLPLITTLAEGGKVMDIITPTNATNAVSTLTLAQGPAAAGNVLTGNNMLVIGNVTTTNFGGLPSAAPAASVSGTLSFSPHAASLSAGTLQAGRTITVFDSPAANDLVVNANILSEGSLFPTGTTLAKAGLGRLVLSGNNSFLETLTINAGPVLVTSNTALGVPSIVTGQFGTTVAAGAALELSGGLTFTDEQFSVSGSGQNYSGARAYAGVIYGTGGLRSISGTNTIAASPGSAQTVTTLLATNTAVGVDAGSTLRIDGGLAFANVNNINIVKVGGGELELAGDFANIVATNSTLLDLAGNLRLSKTGTAQALPNPGGGAMTLTVGDGRAPAQIIYGALAGRDQIGNAVNLVLNNSGTLDMSSAALANSEVQRLIYAPTTAGGSYTLNFANYTTSSLVATSTAGDIQSALEALPVIGVGNVAVSGSNGDFRITFQNQLANTNLPQIGVGTSGSVLTGIVAIPPTTQTLVEGFGNETQVLQFLGTTSTGSVRLVFGTHSGAPLDFSTTITSGDVQANLGAIPTIGGAGNVQVLGGDLGTSAVTNGTILVTFKGDLGAIDAPNLTFATNATTLAAITPINTLGGGGNEAMNLVFSGGAGPTTNYRLSFGGFSTQILVHGSANFSTSGTIQAALEALPSIGAGNVTVTGSTTSTSGAAYMIVFKNDLGQRDANAIGFATVGGSNGMVTTGTTIFAGVAKETLGTLTLTAGNSASGGSALV
ncbi:MAG: autotransporter-associated beta strand repeat-containing protein, partial [Planctomycetaceae bacterium]|nr:autotransporter-associated beta strand repeat-containing protein [Planctomycetaceae bacterium]